MEATHEIEIFHEPREAGKTPDLLLRWEPAPLVFFRNLFDTLLPFWGPDNSTSSRPALFWGDVFVFEGVSWWPMLESALWHLVLVAALWNVSLIWGPGQTLAPRMAFSRDDVVYYEPTFPALKAAHPPTAVPARSSSKPSGPAAMRVAAEAARGATGATQAPPNVALGSGSQLSMMESSPSLPEMPMAATAGRHLVLPSDALAAIAPPPEVNRAGAGGPGGNRMEVTVIAPPPEISGAGGRKGGAVAPGPVAVGPAPSVQGAGRQNGKFEVGQAQVVAPSPQLPMHERRGGPGTGAGLGGAAASAAVGPAPTLERTGTFAAAGPGTLLSNGVPVVPPPPSIDGSGTGAGSRRIAGAPGGSWRAVPPAPSMTDGSSAGGSGSGRVAGLPGGAGQAVPPAPSVGAGAGGGGGFRGLLASLFGGGSGAVPPAPSVNGAGVGGSGRGAGLSATGVQAVGPPPAVEGVGGNGTGRGGSLGGSGVQAVGPAPSVDGLGNGNGAGRGGPPTGGLKAVGPAPSLDGSGGGGGRRVASLGNGADGAGVAGGGAGGTGKSPGMIKQAAPPDVANPEAEPDNVPGAHELPVRIIALALALPNTSFFSNYEVFIAERRTRSNRTQLIKLVYESLPYEQRLSDYNLKEAKVYKLRVVRDHSCDETLIQMTWPDQSGPHPQIGANPAATDDSKDKLPCYRTTAEDYRKALRKK